MTKDIKKQILDNDKKKLLILRPYQIHAIEAMRAASKTGKSGYIWHTTGSGKTMTSYKATRNLLMDIPSIQKTVFLIDRKDLDLQTKGAFQSYADMLTVESIAVAQKYYEMILKIKAGEDELKISEDVKKALPDFPKVAITFSVSENEESSQANQEAMKRYLAYYNKIFGTKYGIDGLSAYNGNLNDRLARKEKRYADREQQVDIVIVVDRLLTGFDAPCLSTLFIDRPPMSPQGLIQAFSRTNRLFDQNKEYGQIVTFRSPKEYKRYKVVLKCLYA